MTARSMYQGWAAGAALVTTCGLILWWWARWTDKQPADPPRPATPSAPAPLHPITFAYPGTQFVLTRELHGGYATCQTCHHNTQRWPRTAPIILEARKHAEEHAAGGDVVARAERIVQVCEVLDKLGWPDAS